MNSPVSGGVPAHRATLFSSHDRGEFLFVPLRLIMSRGQRENEAAALTRPTVAFHPDPSTHCLNELLANVNPQSGAAPRTIHIPLQPHKPFKQLRLIFRWHAQAVIADAHGDVVARLVTGNLHVRAGRRIFESVCKQVEHDLAQAEVIGHYVDGVRNIDAERALLTLNLRFENFRGLQYLLCKRYAPECDLLGIDLNAADIHDITHHQGKFIDTAARRRKKGFTGFRWKLLIEVSQ